MVLGWAGENVPATLGAASPRLLNLSEPMPLPIVFHPDYNVPLPPGHRFPIGKFGRIKELLLADGAVRHEALRRPEPVS